MKIFYTLAILTVLNLINSVFAEEYENSDSVPTYQDVKEDFYIIHVIDPSLENPNRKRDETGSTTLEATYKIHDLIINNYDTYKNTTVLENLKERSNLLKKRSLEENEEERIDTYPKESVYITQLAEAYDRSYLYTYLSESVFREIEKLPYISFIEKDLTYEEEYNKNSIIKQTNWSGLTVRSKSRLHLSAISQGDYSSNRINSYDTNYYYPSTGGEGIDVYIMDTGFNFNGNNFSNTSNRVVRCLANGNTDQSAIYIHQNKKVCQGSDHGTIVAAILGGQNDGVAKNVNIYGIFLKEKNDATILRMLDYIRRERSPKKNNRAVINISIGGYHDVSSYYKKDIISKAMVNMLEKLESSGFVTIASAGNDSKKMNDGKRIHLPSGYDSIISVGSVLTDKVSSIDKTFTKRDLSNYGCDIYAPGNFKVSYYDSSNKLQSNKDHIGTSFSSAIVSGVSALVMGENENKTYNSASMRKYLLSIAQKNRISGAAKPNYFINNGKKIVYSLDNKYKNSCGMFGGLQKCATSKCCGKDYKCYVSSNSYCLTTNGCQATYGVCKK